MIGIWAIRCIDRSLRNDREGLRRDNFICQLRRQLCSIPLSYCAVNMCGALAGEKNECWIGTVPFWSPCCCNICVTTRTAESIVALSADGA